MKKILPFFFVTLLLNIAGCSKKDTTETDIPKDHTNYIDLTVDGVTGRYGQVGDVVSVGPNGDERAGGFLVSQGGMMIAKSSFVEDETQREGIFFQLLINGANGKGVYTATGKDPEKGIASIFIRTEKGAFGDPTCFSTYSSDANYSRTSSSCDDTHPLPSEGITIEYTSWGTKRGEITEGNFHGVFYEDVKAYDNCESSVRHIFSGTFKFAFQ